jgi:hypothetical protein
MDDVRAGEDGFAAMDPRLTVFALANGVDLAKGEGYRRLEWFSDGFERGIVIEADGDASFYVGIVRWKSAGTEEEVPTPTPLERGVNAQDVVSLLDRAVEAANAL